MHIKVDIITKRRMIRTADTLGLTHRLSDAHTLVGMAFACFWFFHQFNKHQSLQIPPSKKLHSHNSISALYHYAIFECTPAIEMRQDTTRPYCVQMHCTMYSQIYMTRHIGGLHRVKYALILLVFSRSRSSTHPVRRILSCAHQCLLFLDNLSCTRVAAYTE